MTSRERIKRIMDFKVPDRVGICDDFDGKAVQKWRAEGMMPGGIGPQEYFDFDIRLFGFDQCFRLDSENKISLERINSPSCGEGAGRMYIPA